MDRAIENDLTYWKKQAVKYQRDLEVVQEEFSDFETNSRQLEKELEKELQQTEKQNKELKTANEILMRERDSYRDKYEQMATESRKQISRLEEDLEIATSQRDEITKQIRELEQSNDDLDRAKRNAIVSLEDFEKKLNEAIERNAMLENELDEKDLLQTRIQRLREETRDLRQELQVREQKDTTQKIPKTPTPSTISQSQIPTIANKGIPRSVTVDSGPSPSVRRTTSTDSPLTASARISALNIVGDLLRKVGALETKLQSCRKFAADSSLDQGSPRGPQPKQPHLSNEKANGWTKSAKVKN